MNRTGPKEKESPNPNLQKLLLVCGALLLCALAYVFIRVQTAQSPVIAVVTPTPAPTPTATPQMGVREAKALDALAGAGLELGEYNGEAGRLSIALPSTGQKGTAYTGDMEFAKREGFVRGFLLELPALSAPVKEKQPNAYAQGLYDGRLLRYEMDLELQRELVHLVLTSMLGALDSKGEVAPGMALLWENEVESLLEDGQSYSEQAGDFTFLAVRTRTARLQISLSK